MPYLILFLFLSFNTCYAQTDTLKPTRLAIVGLANSSVMIGSYAYVKNSWWSDNAEDFHFDDGSDLRYAKNVDKASHFMGGLIVADIFTSSLKWSGLNEKKSYLYGAALGSFIQLSIEMKDAYAPYWGFSIYDFGAGTIGAIVPYAERYWKPMEYIDFKMSYYKRSNHYWDLTTAQKPDNPPSKYHYHDDYINQTYWLSVYPLKNVGSDIGLAFGFGLDESQYLDGKTKRGGKNEFYIALDYDLKRVLKRWNSPFAKKMKHWLNYIKIPAPTIRVAPELEFYPFFM